ncbi:MAG: cell wall-binding repeat-containing protein [Clostridia bacterium]|nr:cell wall-binding repeat-containing protein [Clostridia bacterium]
MKTISRPLFSFLAAVLLLGAFSFSSLAAEKEVTLTLESSPAEGGFVEGGGTYPERTPLTINAVAAVGYRFVNWSTAEDRICSTRPDYTFLLYEDTRLFANFERVEMSEGKVPVILTADSRAEANHSVTVDTAAMASLDSDFSSALKNGAVEFRWYKNEKLIPEANGKSRGFTSIDVGHSFFVQVLYGEHYVNLSSFTIYPESTDSPVSRIYGADRYETAFAAADALKKELGVYRFKNIVVASGTDFADALSGSYLASAKNAPTLLVCSNSAIQNEVKDYIKANLVSNGTVYILGGEVAVPASMENGLEGFNVVRLGGANRYETNLLILKEAGVGQSDILVCTGTNFADSLSASSTKLPILLVRHSLEESQKEFLASTSGTKYIIGGTNAVPEKLETELKAYGEVRRIGGATRFETSVLVAEEFFASPSFAVLAYAANFPDGLSAGPLAAYLNAPLILTDSNNTVASGYAEKNGIRSGYVAGGKILISDKAVRNIFDMDVRTLIDGSDIQWNLVPANINNPVDPDFSVSLKTVQSTHSVDARIFNDLTSMLNDARALGYSPLICASYRTMADQQKLYLSRVADLLEQGLSLSEAEAEAALVVAVPGTSEHQLGLAVDIVSSGYQILDKAQENTPEQKWLMKNSWKYGFILRYPEGKSEITGITYEPWHYRYVGKDAAKLMYEKGLTLEEYLAYYY